MHMMSALHFCSCFCWSSFLVPFLPISALKHIILWVSSQSKLYVCSQAQFAWPESSWSRCYKEMSTASLSESSPGNSVCSVNHSPDFTELSKGELPLRTNSYYSSSRRAWSRHRGPILRFKKKKITHPMLWHFHWRLSPIEINIRIQI